MKTLYISNFTKRVKLVFNYKLRTKVFNKFIE